MNRPVIRAYRCGEDILWPQATSNIQDAPYVFRVEYKTPQQILSYVATDGWNKKWADGVISTRQEEYDVDTDPYERNSERWMTEFEYDKKNLVKIVWAYQKLIDENGIMGIYQTIFCPDYSADNEKSKSNYAKHGLLEYRLKGRYPFWSFRREDNTRRSFNSRGVPDHARDFQRISKAHFDADIDNTNLRLDPPFEYIIGRPQLERGPGASWPVSRRGEVGYGETPDYHPADRQLRELVIDLARDYYGLDTTPEHQNEARAKRQALINRWLRNWQQVIRMVFWMSQQYGDDYTTFRVIGSNTENPQEFMRNSDEQIDFYLTFDVLSNEPQEQQGKIENMIQILSAMDRQGSANWTEAMRVALDNVDPSYAERLVRPESEMVQEQQEEAIKHFEKLWAGMDVTLPQQGINTQLWRQLLQVWLQGSDDIPATDVQTRLQNDEAFKARLEKLTAQLDFMDQQNENANIGRLGVQPGNL